MYSILKFRNLAPDNRYYLSIYGNKYFMNFLYVEQKNFLYLFQKMPPLSKRKKQIKKLANTKRKKSSEGVQFLMNLMMKVMVN